MRKFLAVIPCLVFILSCNRSDFNPELREISTKPPSIKIISPTIIPTLHPGEVLEVKAHLYDPDIIYVASWEAVRASVICGNNQYSQQFEPKQCHYDMDFKFYIPDHFAGDQVINIYGVDGLGNIATAQVHFKATN